MTAQLQLFPALPPAIEAALRASIERFGVLVPVVQDQQGRILDGHHRSRIAATLGVKYRVDVVRVRDEEEARDIQQTLNADRRQLSEEQRREIALALRQEGHSERAIAGALGVSDSTVHRDLEHVRSTASCEAVEPERIVGRDGKSRPARRPAVVATLHAAEAARAQRALLDLGEALPFHDDDTAITPVQLARAQKAQQRAERAENRLAAPPEGTSSFLALSVSALPAEFILARRRYAPPFAALAPTHDEVRA